MKLTKSFYVTGCVLAVGLGALFVTALATRSSSGDVTVLKLAHGLDASHPVHKGMEFMADRLREKSDGKMIIQIFPSEQLGAERECIEQLQIGCLDMTKSSTASLESFLPEVSVFGVPYVFRDREHFWKVLDGPIGDRFLEAGKRVGLHGICYYDSGSRSFYTKSKMIKTPDDLVGMKIRVIKSKTAMAMVEALGGSPTPISWGELYTALQQGVVDGAENNEPSFQTSRHYEICKYYSLDEHTMVPDVVLLSEVVWNQLTAEQQRLLREAAVESSHFQRKLWEEKTKESLAIVKEAGVEVFRPDKEPFRAKVRPMHESYAGTEIGRVIAEIQEVR